MRKILLFALALIASAGWNTVTATAAQQLPESALETVTQTGDQPVAPAIEQPVAPAIEQTVAPAEQPGAPVIDPPVKQPVQPPATAQKVPAPQQAKQTDGKQTIQFAFKEADWKDVIPWFADQAGYSLQPISDWPAGTFYLNDDSKYSVMQGLDQLNHALRMRTPPFTLIRNRKMLILAPLEEANFPSELIETVDVNGLDERGKYETITTVFDVGELDVLDMYEEIKPLVSDATNRSAVFPAANQIRVRASGGQLRDIRDLINAAKKRSISDSLELAVHRLKHVDAETFMLVARGLLDMKPNQDSTTDGSLSITRQPLGDHLYLRGTKRMLERFKQVATVIDVAPEEYEGPDVAKQYFQTYSIMVDPKLGFDLLQTVLEGTPARMQQDSVTGSILVRGREEDHLAVKAALTAVEGQGGEAFSIIKVYNGSASDFMLAVQSLLRQTAMGETTGPVVMANSELNQILVRGTPQEVREVERMISELDANATRESLGPRTGTRIISMEPAEMDMLAPMIEDLLHSTGRKNSLNIVLPKERNEIKKRLRGLPENDNRATESAESPEDTKTGLRDVSLTAPAWWLLQNGLGQLGAVTPLLHTNTSLLTFSTPQQNQVGQTSQENQPSPRPNANANPNVNANATDSDYRPAQQVESIHGSPIEAEFTEFGMVLRSDDLDALDDIEQIIYSQLSQEAPPELPTFFFLKHRKAGGMMAFLNQYYGLTSADGGGGGGAGGMMGDMMNNMLGGGTGDLLGGLLGGGTTGSSVSATSGLIGDVRMGVDAAFNAIYVAGATSGDLEQIAELIDVLDQPEAPIDPELVGQFRTIDIIHRDPTEVKTIIETQLSELIDTGGGEDGGGQDNEGRQMMKMMQELTGGGKKGGGGELDQEKPKAKLGVDITTSQLLVTGPEFIYKEILKMVIELDKAELSSPRSMQSLRSPGDTKILMSKLTAMFGDKIEHQIETGEATASSSTSSNGASSEASKKSSAQQKQQENARDAMMQAIRAQQRGGGDGGQRGGGGGGQRGGGGGGQRGGGGGGGGQRGDR